MSAPNHHDRFLKSILQQPERARDYFQLQLPERLGRLIDFDTLTQVSESFVDEKLKGTSIYL